MGWRKSTEVLLWFAQVNRIVHHSENRDSTAVPNEVFCDRSGVALRRAIRAEPAAVDVRCGHGQDVAFERSCRETGKRVRRISRRVRTSIHINRPVDLSNLAPVPDGDQSLREWISLLPDPVISRRHPGIGRNVAHAWMQ